MADKNPHVLLVEDDRVFSEILSRQFESRGATIVHAATGKDALEALKGKMVFDVILLDLSLPDIDGFDLLSQIKGIPALADIPVIVISNFAEEKDIEWGRKLGVKQFIKKVSVMPGEIVDAALDACAKSA